MRSIPSLIGVLSATVVLGVGCNITPPPPATTTTTTTAATVPAAPTTVPPTTAAPTTTVAPTTTAKPATTTTTTTVKPTTTTTTVPAPPATRAFPGDVPRGYVRWGAAVGGNGDPTARHETPAGTTLGLRRTYWSWSQRTTSMITTARADLTAGRLPWVSIKPPANPGWADLAAGRYDTDLDAMLRALDNLGGPVWFTLHHEPEGGGGVPAGQSDDPGGPTAWRAMQTHVRARMNALGTHNIAFAPILMSWTFSPNSGRNPADWWVPGIWDFAGIDHYVESESHPGPGVNDTLWNLTKTFYAARGLKLALGEWGDRGTDTRAADEMTNFYNQALASGDTNNPQVIGLAYFDSDLNSPTGGWALTGEPLTRFHQLMATPTSLHANQ